MGLRLSKIKETLKKLGPGLVTGAADDDPSGIATYTQAGAGYGFGLIWTNLYMLPMMTAVQEMSGRIGLVTGKGLAQNIRENYNRWLLYFAVFFLVFANVINIGADIGAMAASAKLIIDIPYVWLTLFFTIGIVLLEVLIPYKYYSKILKWLCLSLFSYVITAFVVTQPWLEILNHVLIPRFEMSAGFFLTIVAVLGTTISPYLFFWEPSQEVEEQIEHRWRKNHGALQITNHRVRSFRKDNFIGMLFSSTIAFFIMITAASTLHVRGITDVPDAASAAAALEPLVQSFPYAGMIAKTIFALGIIGTGLLAVPVLAGSSAYAVSEALGIEEGLHRKVIKAKGFYAVIAAATMFGLFINFVGIDPIKALIYAAIVNGVMAVPLIFIIIRICNNKKIMGEHTNGALSNSVGFATLAFMLAAVLAMIFIR